MKRRIWELDAFRGICILGVVIVHFVYDLCDLYRIVDWEYPAWFSFIKDWGGILFLLLSGICATLGKRSVRRGLIVLGGGTLVSLVTYGMYRFGFAEKGIIIYFGVLQCLGLCMILWWLFQRLPTWLLAVCGVAMAAAGLYLQGVVLVDHPWLVPLGFTYRGFATADYFPLLPHLGFFLIGAVLGRTAYRKKETLLPGISEQNIFVRFLTFCGRQSLWIYLLHQPILSAICMLLM